MQDRQLDDIMAVLPPLLQSLEALGVVGRYMNPGELSQMTAAIGRPQDALAEALPRLAGWPQDLAGWPGR